MQRNITPIQLRSYSMLSQRLSANNAESILFLPLESVWSSVFIST